MALTVLLHMAVAVNSGSFFCRRVSVIRAQKTWGRALEPMIVGNSHVPTKLVAPLCDIGLVLYSTDLLKDLATKCGDHLA